MAVKDELEAISFELGALTLHGLAFGSAEHPPLLCLHGWLDNAASFEPLMPAVKNRRVIAIDLPGHGLSSHRSVDAHYHFIDWVYDLLQLFELNQWEAIDIVGHSMGGMIASAFAAAFPEKVKSLTLIDSIGFLTEEAKQTSLQLRKGMTSRLKNSTLYLKHHQKIKSKNTHPTIDSAIKARVLVSDMPYSQAQLIVERGLQKQDRGYVWRADSRLRHTSPYRLTLAQAEQIVSDITCPVQLIYASNSLNMVVKGIEHFGPLFKNLTIIKLIGGHHVHMEQPQETAILINKFLNNSIKHDLLSVNLD